MSARRTGPSRRALLPLALLLCAALPARAASGEADLDDADLGTLKGEARARMQDIEQHLTDWDVEGAKRELEELEKVAPKDVEPVRYFRGRVAFEEGRYDEAVQELEAAGVRDRPNSWLRLVKDTRAITKDHVTLESEHFIFSSPKGKDGVLAGWALEALEAQRRALEHDLGYAPPGKVRVELVANAAELAKTSTLTREAIKTTGTIAICKFNKLIVTSPAAVLRGYDWLDTMAHEYTHLVVSKKSRNTVPIWMHEGLAKYLESRWRGAAGLALSPSTLALLGARVRANTLVPFEKMHPSMALLPTAEDAATAFAEVFFAIKLVHVEHGDQALEAMLAAMAKGQSDRQAIELVTKKKWPDFERAWMASLKKLPYPKELIPPSFHEKKELAENGKKAPRGRDIAFGDFVEVVEPEARRAAHLGEVLRERRRMGAAAEQYEKAWRQVGDRYESISNKYALSLLELERYDEAEKVLEGSLTMHPGSAATNVHLGRIALRTKAWAKVKAAALEALAVDPFDPEVHLLLYAGAKGLNDTPLATRAQDASALLLGVPPAQVPAIVQALGKSAVSEATAPAPAPVATPAASPTDAGAPKP